MLSGVQTGNGIPYDKYDVRDIAHARTDRKDDIFMQRRLYIDETHGAGHIPHCASNTTFVVLVYSTPFICN